MKKELLITLGLLVSSMVLAQNGGNCMSKCESQQPQTGRGSVHVAYQGKAIDQMVYEFMEEQGILGMTLAIVQAPYIPRIVGYGVTDFEKRQPCCRQDALAHRPCLAGVYRRCRDATI